MDDSTRRGSRGPKVVWEDPDSEDPPRVRVPERRKKDAFLALGEPGSGPRGFAANRSTRPGRAAEPGNLDLDTKSKSINPGVAVTRPENQLGPRQQGRPVFKWRQTYFEREARLAENNRAGQRKTQTNADILFCDDSDRIKETAYQNDICFTNKQNKFRVNDLGHTFEVDNNKTSTGTTRKKTEHLPSFLRDDTFARTAPQKQPVATSRYADTWPFDEHQADSNRRETPSRRSRKHPNPDESLTHKPPPKYEPFEVFRKHAEMMERMTREDSFDRLLNTGYKPSFFEDRNSGSKVAGDTTSKDKPRASHACAETVRSASKNAASSVLDPDIDDSCSSTDGDSVIIPHNAHRIRGISKFPVNTTTNERLPSFKETNTTAQGNCPQTKDDTATCDQQIDTNNQSPAAATELCNLPLDTSASERSPEEHGYLCTNKLGGPDGGISTSPSNSDGNFSDAGSFAEYEEKTEDKTPSSEDRSADAISTQGFDAAHLAEVEIFSSEDRILSADGGSELNDCIYNYTPPERRAHSEGATSLYSDSSGEIQQYHSIAELETVSFKAASRNLPSRGSSSITTIQSAVFDIHSVDSSNTKLQNFKYYIIRGFRRVKKAARSVQKTFKKCYGAM